MSWKPATAPSRIPKWVPQRLHGPIRFCVKTGLVVLALGVALGLFYLYLASKYDLAEVAKMPERTVILDRNGEEYAALHGERRRLITYEEIPKELELALYAREDLRFPDHSGIDARGLARATVRNVRDWSFTQGASTLTMQLTRNTYELRAKSLHRKLLEMAITLRIEGRYEKAEILTHYLNRIYFGSGCHGIEEAAQTYFGRSVSDLHIGESATLVGIIRGPHIFSPFRNLDGAKDQRDEVLSRMVTCGFITKEEKATAIAMPLRIVPPEERHRHSSYPRERIRKQLQIILDKNDIRAGGLKVYTTLDIAAQTRAESILQSPPLGTAGLQAAMIQIDPSNGGIIAYCGGRNYVDSAFDRAQGARRDLGPTFYPFLTAIALERRKVPIEGKPLQTGRQLGVQETARLSQRFGFTPPFNQTEDLYRGTIAASPMQVATASCALINDGAKPNPYFISKITDLNGNILYTRDPTSSQAISSAVAEETLDHLKKTTFINTTHSVRDAWAINLDPKTTTLIWLGYDSPQKIGTANNVTTALGKMLKKATR
ncbi:MAG: transglycosylase domain-containing protein [Akkermansiaceae bacterium]